MKKPGTIHNLWSTIYNFYDLRIFSKTSNVSDVSETVYKNLSHQITKSFDELSEENLKEKLTSDTRYKFNFIRGLGRCKC